MEKLILYPFFITAFILTACKPKDSVPLSSSIVISDVNIVDVTDGDIKPNQTVIITGNYIAEIGPANSLAVPDEATVINAKGMYLIPGLWDMHTHTMASIKDAIPINNLLIANGITGIRGPGANSQSLAEMTRPAIQSGEMAGPVRMNITGDIVYGTYARNPDLLSAQTPKEGTAIVDSLVRAGAPFIKVYNTLNRDTYFAIAKRTRELGVPLSGHVPISIHAREASDTGQRSIEHLISGILQACSELDEETYRDIDRLLSQQPSPGTKKKIDSLRISIRSAPFSEEGCNNTLQRFSQNSTWVVPTHLAGWGASHANDSLLNNDPRRKYLSGGLSTWWHKFLQSNKAIVASWYDNMNTIAGMLEKHNVPILIGTDTPIVPMTFPGFSIHDEMELLVKAGLSPLYVLQGATINPVRYFGKTDSLGTVEEGKLADLVLLEANPLEDITNTRRIRAVIANGQLYKRQQLDSLLAETERIFARRSLFSLLSETLKKEDFDTMEKRYQALMKSMPDSVQIDVWQLPELGNMLLKQGRNEEAFTVFEWNANSYPYSPYAFGFFAEALVENGNYEAANKRYQQAIDIARQQDHPSLYYFQAQIERLAQLSE